MLCSKLLECHLLSIKEALEHVLQDADLLLTYFKYTLPSDYFILLELEDIMILETYKTCKEVTSGMSSYKC